MVNIYAVMWISVHLSGWTSDDATLGRLEHPLLDDCCMTIRSALFFPDTLKITFLTRSLHGKMQQHRERKRFGALACKNQQVAADARLPPVQKEKENFSAAFLGVVKAERPHRPSRSDNSLSPRLQLLINAAFQENTFYPQTHCDCM